MKFRGRARSRPARGKCPKALRKTGEVPQHNAERPDTTPNDNETDTVPCLPFASRSIASLPLFRRATFVAPAAAMVSTQGTLSSTSETAATNFWPNVVPMTTNQFLQRTVTEAFFRL